MTKFIDILQHYILPLGFLLFLTGMIYFSSMSAYQGKTYLFFMLPSVILMMINFKVLKNFSRDKTFWLLIGLFAYMATSLAWNDTIISDIAHLKRLVLIFIFLMGAIYMGENHTKLIINLLLSATIMLAISGCYAIYLHYSNHNGLFATRFVGIGNFSNPLLSSHVYGVFTVFLMAYISTQYQGKLTSFIHLLIVLFIILFVMTLLTQSRTAMLALTMATLALFLWCQPKITLYFISLLILSATIILIFKPDIILARGFSARPELWKISLEKISLAPCLGHGLATKLDITIPRFYHVFSEPHNIYLGTAYYGGMLGLLLLLMLLLNLIYSSVLIAKSNPLAMIGIAMLIYGLTAGMTEGGNIFPRPKETWFIIWLPIALLLMVKYKHLKQLQTQDIDSDNSTNEICIATLS